MGEQRGQRHCSGSERRAWGGDSPAQRAEKGGPWLLGSGAGGSELGGPLLGEALAVGASGPSFMRGLGCSPKGHNGQCVCCYPAGAGSFGSADPVLLSPSASETFPPLLSPAAPPLSFEISLQLQFRSRDRLPKAHTSNPPPGGVPESQRPWLGRPGSVAEGPEPGPTRCLLSFWKTKHILYRIFS